MRIQWEWEPFKGVLIVKPLAYRDRLPALKKLEVINGDTHIVPMDLFANKIAIGAIPEGYKLESADKYRLVFKTNTPVKRSKKRKS